MKLNICIFLRQLEKIKARISQTEKVTCDVELNAKPEFEKAWKLSALSYFKVIYGILNLLFFFKIGNNVRYIFHTPKHKSLIDLFNNDEILVLSGKNQVDICKKNGYKYFIYFGLLESILISKKYRFNFFALIYLYIFYFKVRNKKLIFFLYEDVLPIGAFLSMQIKPEKLKVVMIQHGYASKKSYQYETNECDYYFVYDINKIRPYASKDKCIEIGLPIEASISNNFSGTIIFVGNGLGGVDEINYKESLSIYFKLQTQLQSSYNIKYRPHPSESISEIVNSSLFVDHTGKEELLSGDLKVFIGYESTLMYEAKYLGHICIYLVKDRSVNIDYQVDLLLDESEINKLEEFLPHLIVSSQNSFDHSRSMENLETRFKCAIERLA